jgi:uncharacterized membrane protein YeiH
VAVQRRTALFVVSDAIALALFAVIGLTSHHKGLGLHGVARDALPVLAGWFLAAAVLGTYRRPSWAVFFLTWAVGVGGGVFVRGVVLHRHVLGGRYLTFLAITLAVTLALLLASRWFASLLTRSGGVRRIAAPSGQREPR